MRAAFAVVVCEALLLVALAYLQFETGAALSIDGASALDVPDDPLVSTLGRIEIGMWLVAPLLVGMLVARTQRRMFFAAGLAFGGVASAVVAAPLIEQLAASGWALGPRGPYFFVPPAGWTPNSAYLPLLIPIALIVGGGLSALEATLVAGLARRLRA
jgi:hypothetical protein